MWCRGSLIDARLLITSLACQFRASQAHDSSQTIARGVAWSQGAWSGGVNLVQLHTSVLDKRANSKASNRSDRSVAAMVAGRNCEHPTRVATASYKQWMQRQKTVKSRGIRLSHDRFRPNLGGGKKKGGSEGGSKVDNESSVEEEPSGEEGDEEEEHAESAISVAIAGTLLGSIAGALSLLYLLNHRDNDIKQASYEIVSTTISILCAILVFQAFNEMVSMLFVSSDSSAAWLVSISVTQFMAWHCVAQFALAFATGAVGGTPPTATIGDIKCRTKCYAVLLAHVTGFAAINAAGSVQQNYFSGTPLLAASVVIICFLFMRAVQRVSFEFRTTIEELDGEVDEFEELWEEENREAENDAMAFALSFTLVQALRFAIGGVLPDQFGEEESGTLFYHSSLESYALLGAGICFLVLTFCGFYLLLPLDWPFPRTNVEIVGTCAMSFAWCLFYGVQWCVGPISPEIFEHDYVLLALLTAMICSAFAFSLIFVIDFICDFFEQIQQPITSTLFLQQQDGEVISRKADVLIALRKIIYVMGVLVGFAWEQAFDVAEESLADATWNKKFYKCAFAMISVLVLIPAWRWYILPMVHQEGWRYGFVIDHIVEIHGHEGVKKLIDDHVKKQNILSRPASCRGSFSGQSTPQSSRTPTPRATASARDIRPDSKQRRL